VQEELDKQLAASWLEMVVRQHLQQFHLLEEVQELDREQVHSLEVLVEEQKEIPLVQILEVLEQQDKDILVVLMEQIHLHQVGLAQEEAVERDQLEEMEQILLLETQGQELALQ
jgi:hypothetical protein